MQVDISLSKTPPLLPAYLLPQYKKNPTLVPGTCLGYKAIVIKEACATLNDQMQRNNLEDMEKFGILTLDLAALLKEIHHE